MATRSIFNTTVSATEKTLVENLIIEAIQIYGIDMYYLPKTISNDDGFFGEDAGTTQFSTAFPIEMYVKNVESYEGEGEFLSTFGLEIKDQITFTVANSRFIAETSTQRPQEGDLVWFPTVGKMFKIQFVEPESIFFQMGQLPVFDLQCELFDWQGEVFTTGIAEIDDYGIAISPKTTYDLTPGGTGTFVSKEIVYQGASLETAAFTGYVSDFDDATPTITLYGMSTQPTDGVVINGDTSGAQWTVSINAADVEQNEMETTGGDNWIIEQEADQFIDFSENNPFGEM